MKIFKYPLLYIAEPEVVRLPNGAEVLSAHPQEWERGIMLWAMVDPGVEEMEERIFVLQPTGKEFPAEAMVKFYNTIVLKEQQLVFHFIELKNVKAWDPKEDDRISP